MNNSEVYIVVEGPTEQTFVRDVLAPKMANKSIFLYPILIGKPGHKGGDVRFERAINDIGNFLKQRSDTYISTMFDYFRIDSNWPGKNEINQKGQSGVSLSAIDKATIIENATHKKIVEIFSEYNSENRFISYIEMHEFEALLFSDTDILANKLEINVSKIKEIIDEYDNCPEEINDNPDKAPSKRLEALSIGYRKVAMGKSISEAIGIKNIRTQCPNFNKWLTKLEQLGG